MSKNEIIRKLICGNRDTILSCRNNIGSTNPEKPEDMKSLIFDGIVDEEMYNKAPVKIMYLLKETTSSWFEENSEQKTTANEEERRNEFIKNDYGLECWNYILTTNRLAKRSDEHGNSGDKIKHWKSICYWTHCIFSIHNKEATSYKKCLEFKDLGKELLKISIVNVKKSPGQNSSDDKIIEYNAKTTRNLLTEEIKIISPSIVICGGTFSSAKILYNDSKVETLDCGVEYFKTKTNLENNRETLFVNLIHPSQIGAAAKLPFQYSYIKTIFEEIEEKKLYD